MGCLDGFLGSNNKITHLLFALIASTCILHQHFPLFGLVSTNPFTQHWLTSKKQGLQPSFLELTSQPWTFLSALHKTKQQEQNQNNKNQTTQNRKSKIKETKNKHRADRKVHGPHPPPLQSSSDLRFDKAGGGTICWVYTGVRKHPIRQSSVEAQSAGQLGVRKHPSDFDKPWTSYHALCCALNNHHKKENQKRNKNR